MKTLKLFNAVVAKESNEAPYFAKEGLIIESNALWAKNAIVKFYQNDMLDGYGLNKTFHKSWLKIKDSSREELWMKQILHYMSTYGSNFQDEVYIPGEVLDVPETKVVFKVIKGYSKEELTAKCLNLLKSGIALQEETIHDLLSVLCDELGYQFTGQEDIRNKETIAILADTYSVLPTETLSFFRYIIYKATGESLLIKNEAAIEAIKASKFNPGPLFEQFGLEKLAEIFNRFKPLFLAFKERCPKTINKISKLSKTHHKPMVVNPLNMVTSVALQEEDTHWLDNATPFALFKALNACYTRIEGQKAFIYRIRNGKSFVKETGFKNVVWANYFFLENYLKTRFDFTGLSFYLPHEVHYALPTSEKLFVGNIPTGTRFFGKALAVGVYWENSWGARDIDVSGINIRGKVGWNSDYKQADGELMYSGDITDAQNGAVEYLYASHGLSNPTLITSNVFYGKSNCEYKIIVGKGSEVNYNYMMDPNKRFIEVKCQSVQKQTILGILLPEGAQQSFVLLNFGAGHSHVSRNSRVSDLATEALHAQWSSAIMLPDVIEILGGTITTKAKEADYDLSLEKLKKDSLIKLFTENEKKK